MHQPQAEDLTYTGVSVAMEVEASAAGALIATNAVLTSLLAGCSQALVSVCESRRRSCSHLSTWNPLIPLSHPGQGHWGPANGLHPHCLSSAQAALSLGRGKDTASLSPLPLSVFLWSHLPMISRRSSPKATCNGTLYSKPLRALPQ